MKNLKFRFILCLFPIAFLSSCSFQNNPSLPKSNTLVLLSEGQSQCETKIREKIELRQIPFSPEPAFADILSEAKELYVATPDMENYNISEDAHQIQSISRTFSFNEEGWSKSLTFEIGLNARNATQPMYLILTYAQFQDQKTVRLSQRYAVTPDCQIQLHKTNLEQLLKLNESEISHSSKTIASNEVIEDKKETHKIPEGKTDISFNSHLPPAELIKIFEANKNAVTFLTGFGFADVEIADLDEENQMVFGESYRFTRKKMNLIFNGSPLFEALVLFNQDSEVYITQVPKLNSVSRTVPKRFGSKILLGEAQLGNSYFISKLLVEYQFNNPSFLITTNKPLEYDHLSAYFEKTLMSSENGKYTYRLTEMSSPVIRAPVTPADLEVNSTIQSDLPEIKAIASQISSISSERKQQIAEILKYLSVNYTYDHDMVQKNTVRALSTKEALDRKKGVCQHYAVLFTAIARALKIPTRIVVGYAVTTEIPMMHAWVETEVEEGLWQVIEPQVADGLTSMQTRFYFPLTRGYFLEDMNRSQVDYITLLLGLQIQADPIKSAQQ